MTIDWSLIVSGLACAAGGAGLLLHARQRAVCAAQRDRLRGELFDQAMAGAAQFDTLRLQIENLEVCMQTSDELLRDGRLSRSMRASVVSAK